MRVVGRKSLNTASSLERMASPSDARQVSDLPNSASHIEAV